jgi:hypothetical protein
VRRQLNRRTFLIAGAASLAAGAWIGLEWILDEDARDRRAKERLTAVVGALFRDLDAAREVGSAYLKVRPEEDDERRLVRLLEASNRAWTSPRSVAQTRRLIRKQTRRDFAAADIVALDGWYLSRTEARLCALSSFA